MMPVPTHLTKCTLKLSDKEKVTYKITDRFPEDLDHQYVAKVRCSCDNEIFDVLYPGEVNDYGPCVTKFNGEYFFIIKARCTHCAKEHLLYDDDLHGWNGWICHEDKKDELTRPVLAEWHCKECLHTKHKIIIIINSQGKEDFIDEAGEDYDVNRWQDAFDWITFDISCESCGKRSEEFISHECM